MPASSKLEDISAEGKSRPKGCSTVAKPIMSTLAGRW
jgi:hypothetical protein